MTRTAALAALSALTLATAGCGAFRSLIGTNTVDLEDAQIQAVRLDLRKEKKTLCPREPVQIAVLLQATLDGEGQPRWYETWQGKADADRNGKLAFEDFTLTSDHGKIDPSGWFSPTTDLLATVDKELTIRAVYNAAPTHAATASYRPDYDCITAGGGRGLTGKPGLGGRGGNAGVQAGGGQTGGDGNIGMTGEPGEGGGPGPELRAFATYVSTPFYPKLIAVRVEGPTPDFLLAPPGKVVTVKASGGNGGNGGPGGDGGPGGQGGQGDPTPGDGGRGGDGGPGGQGGSGGPGGAVELVYDERFPELAQAVRLDVSGGAAGEPGPGGRGGRGGAGGLQPQATTQDGGGQGERGGDGAMGPKGSPGQPGASGTSSSRAGQISPVFRGLRGVTPL